VARGWYGLHIGDRVKYKLLNDTYLIGEIIELCVRDKNSAYMITDDGRKIQVICERCEKIN
jgi:hypothetical protein